MKVWNEAQPTDMAWILLVDCALICFENKGVQKNSVHEDPISVNGIKLSYLVVGL